MNEWQISSHRLEKFSLKSKATCAVRVRARVRVCFRFEGEHDKGISSILPGDCVCIIEGDWLTVLW